MDGESDGLPDEVSDRIRSIRRRGVALGVVTGLAILGIYGLRVWFVGGWSIDTAAPAGTIKNNLSWYAGYLLLIIVVAEIATKVMLLVSREVPARYIDHALEKLAADYSDNYSENKSE